MRGGGHASTPDDARHRFPHRGRADAPVVEGGPDLGAGPLAERRRLLAERHDAFRAFALNEPRGFDAMVGALLCEPVDARLRGRH